MEKTFPIMEALKYFGCSPTMLKVKVDHATHQCYWVNKKTGDVKVTRVVCSQNMGLSINPQGAKIQMEGCIIMGLGYALQEDVHFKGGAIK